MAMLAAVLDEGGKSVVAWVEQDQPEVLHETERLENKAHCTARSSSMIRPTTGRTSNRPSLQVHQSPDSG